MIFPLIISLVSIAISICFPFIMFRNHKEYNKYKDLINNGLTTYSQNKAVIEFYLKNGYKFSIQPLTINYRKSYNLHIKIYKTAGTQRIDDIFKVSELTFYDVNDYILLSFIDAYDNGFVMYNANNIDFINPPIDDEIRIIKLDSYMDMGYLPEVMFMLMLIDYCNGKPDYYNKLIKGYEYYTFDMFLCGRYAIYSNKYTI